MEEDRDGVRSDYSGLWTPYSFAAPIGGRAMSRSQALLEARDFTLLDLVDRAVDHGVVLAGDITISVADIDLIYVGLRVLLASVERVEEFRVERERAVGREVREEDRHEY